MKCSTTSLVLAVFVTAAINSGYAYAGKPYMASVLKIDDSDGKLELRETRHSANIAEAGFYSISAPANRDSLLGIQIPRLFIDGVPIEVTQARPYIFASDSTISTRELGLVQANIVPNQVVVTPNSSVELSIRIIMTESQEETLLSLLRYENTVLMVQHALNSLGYSTGVPDGLIGEKTRTAVRAFQADRGLPVTGKIDEATAAELKVPYRAK
jgi:hypothetical protein